MVDHQNLVEAEVKRRFFQKKVHIAVSLTDKCPLRCDHCIVSAVYGGKVDIELSIKIANRILEEIAIPKNRIGAISFTGGEAPLARSAFKILGTGAAQAGVKCALITSGYWAPSPAKADQFLVVNNFLRQLTISIDRFHQEYLNLGTALNAVDAGVRAGLVTSIRFSRYRNDPESDELFNEIRSKTDVDIEIQHMVGGGRAGGDLPDDFVPDDDQVLSQCFSSGPHIEFNGDMLPCCSNIIHLTNDHPLRIGNILETPVGEMLDPYFSNQILKTLRVFGWDHVASEAGIKIASGIELACHGGCRQCEAALSDEVSLASIDRWQASGMCSTSARAAESWIAAN